MRLLIKFLYALLCASSTISFSMDSVNWFTKLPEPICKEILYQLPFLTFLKSRSVCKDWRNKIDAAYTKKLQEEQAELDKYYKQEGFHKRKNISGFIASSIHKANKDHLTQWKRKKNQELVAIEHNLVIWLHNYIKNKDHNDPIMQQIEQILGHQYMNPLAQAAMYDSLKVVDLLFDMGEADLKKDNPLEKAIENDHTEIAKKLIKAGAPMYFKRENLAIPESGHYIMFDALELATQKENLELIQFIQNATDHQSEMIQPYKPKKRKLKTIETIVDVNF